MVKSWIVTVCSNDDHCRLFIRQLSHNLLPALAIDTVKVFISALVFLVVCLSLSVILFVCFPLFCHIFHCLN